MFVKIGQWTTDAVHYFKRENASTHRNCIGHYNVLIFLLNKYTLQFTQSLWKTETTLFIRATRFNSHYQRLVLHCNIIYCLIWLFTSFMMMTCNASISTNIQNLVYFHESRILCHKFNSFIRCGILWYCTVCRHQNYSTYLQYKKRGPLRTGCLHFGKGWVVARSGLHTYTYIRFH